LARIANKEHARSARDATCGPGEGTHKKERDFHASNWLFAQTTHVDVTP